MSSFPVDTLAGVPKQSPAAVSARLDRLPATRAVWVLVLLLSLGGWFEFYDLFFTAYVGPGLVKSGLFSTTTASFFGFSGLGSFVAATFAGLFIGTFAFGSLADRFGRKTIFTFSLLWYTVATVIMAFQNSAGSINLWRLIAGVGIGIELVTIDTYICELVPRTVRGRAFAFNQAVQFSVVPVVALIAWWLVPLSPLGLDGWRWVVLIGAFSAICVWIIRARVPESPRWLAEQGRVEQAEQVMAKLETQVAAEYGRPLPPVTVKPEVPKPKARFAEIWEKPYRSRTIMLMVFNFFQTIGYYGFAAWVPTLLIAKGITVTHSLLYSVVIAFANPLCPFICILIADKIERKWQIVLAALGVTVFGLLFAVQTSAVLLVVLGLLVTASNGVMSFAFHAYQAELFPTRVRARAVGFVYSLSRLSAMLSGFLIAFCLRHFDVIGVFSMIGVAMLVVMGSIGWFGPRTNGLELDQISR